ncbi:hypothetical protein LZ30DRAFT_268249 [Colletotrichum cereale]|nr:hypothetical protein LZ30DRAFT_268249 [Colletotrichum cereale]
MDEPPPGHALERLLVVWQDCLEWRSRACFFLLFFLCVPGCAQCNVGANCIVTSLISTPLPPPLHHIPSAVLGFCRNKVMERSRTRKSCAVGSCLVVSFRLSWGGRHHRLPTSHPRGGLSPSPRGFGLDDPGLPTQLSRRVRQGGPKDADDKDSLPC